MQIIVVSNFLSKRIEYFIEAGKHLQVEVRFMTYGELFNCLPQLRQAVIKLEPCVSDETNFLKYALLNQAYKETLQRLGEMRLSDEKSKQLSKLSPSSSPLSIVLSLL